MVSLSSTPAAKAPAVSEKPSFCVMSDAPVTVSRHSATNVSSLLDSATTYTHDRQCQRDRLHRSSYMS